LVALMACSDSTANDSGEARVFMSASASLGAAAANIVSSELGVLNVSQIDSMFVRITAVSALRQDADTSDSSGGWVTIQLADSGGKRINLLKLPKVGVDSIKLAQGSLKAGTYKNIRLIFDSAATSITLKEDVTVGNFNFLKNTPYSLRVPSGVIKVPAAGFTISEDSLSTINLVFEPGTSVQTIVATGSGKLQINPVLHRR
jgi:Domain of unknown function (DUF4382)